MARVQNEPSAFPGLPIDADTRKTRELVDEGVIQLRTLAQMLAALHGSPGLGNKRDPVDELVYIILSRKTREGAYQLSYDALKKRFPTWDHLLRARRDTVARLVYSGGLGARKTESLYGALAKLRETFGRCTLAPARRWPDDRLEKFLCSLPEVSRKSAYCIMMYAFRRQVFPVDTHVGRILARVGIYRELGLSLDGDHKKKQQMLSDLIPPNLRYSLHVNLVAHGREICLSQRPRCERCEIRKLCATFRETQVRRTSASAAPTVVDLFTGAGGLSEGFEQNGFRVVLALDANREAIRTYRYNHPGLADARLLHRDIRTLQPGELKRRVGSPVDVLMGAPPCQGFSQAGLRAKATWLGHRTRLDERNQLFEFMILAARELRPKLFVMENVPGIQSARQDNLTVLEAAAEQLRATGPYRTQIWRLNASAFGVPQERVRFFLVGSRLRSSPFPPEGDYRAAGRHDDDQYALDPVGVIEAIFDLPLRGAGTGIGVDRWPSNGDQWDARTSGDADPRRYLTKFGLRSASPLLFNHTVRYHNKQDLELYGVLRPGEDSTALFDRRDRGDLLRYRKDVFDDKYARLSRQRPAKTIVAHLAKDGNGYIHPTQVRSISIREGARLQSFRDDYVFCGAPSDQWTQLGNAVPPLLAKAIATTFMRTLARNRRA